MEVEAPESLAVVAEFIEQGDQNRRIVHLLNYAAPQGSAFSNVRVDAEWPKGKQVRQVTLLSPDGGEAAIVPSSVENGRVRFTVPRLQTYTIAIIQME